MFFPTLIGIAVFAWAITFVLKGHAQMWRRIAQHYPAATLPPAIAVKEMDQILIVGRGMNRENYVPLQVGVHATGLSFTLRRLFDTYSPPMFLPFSEMQVKQTTWFLNAESFAIRMEKCAGTDIILTDDLMNWIRAHSPQV